MGYQAGCDQVVTKSVQPDIKCGLPGCDQVVTKSRAFSRTSNVGYQGVIRWLLRVIRWLPGVSDGFLG